MQNRNSGPFLPPYGYVILQTPNDGYSAYPDDCNCFKKQSGRRSLIRAARPDEFRDDVQALLWVLVFRVAPDFHEVKPIWRGPPFFLVHQKQPYADVVSDGGIARIYEECLKRGGFDPFEWEKLNDPSRL